MEKQLFVVYFESANYCGYGEHCLVWATDEYDAREAASSYAENFYYEQDYDQWEEEIEGCDDSDVSWATITEVYPLASDAAEDVRRYLQDDTQKHFYPIVN